MKLGDLRGVFTEVDRLSNIFCRRGAIEVSQGGIVKSSEFRSLKDFDFLTTALVKTRNENGKGKDSK